MVDEEATGHSGDQYRVGGQVGSVGSAAQILVDIV
jgi:hypothetical protein